MQNNRFWQVRSRASLALTGAEMPRTSNFSAFTGLADKKDLESHISALKAKCVTTASWAKSLPDMTMRQV
jgi:hypothetical protein